jgi:putative acetyltransferase
VEDVHVRPENESDRVAARDLLVRAFPSDGEARLVEALRGKTDPQVSLVAALPTGGVVGHILFTPVEIRGDSHRSRAMGLGPMAVLPEQQRRGAGSALVAAGLEACANIGEMIVVVLGHPDYYPRFGFRPAEDFGLYYGRPGPNPAFMVCEILRGSLRGRSGEVVYHAAFGSL